MRAAALRFWVAASSEEDGAVPAGGAAGALAAVWAWWGCLEHMALRRQHVQVIRRLAGSR